MNSSQVEKVVQAVLYEGHILYPYRPSSKKNRQRFTFGRVYPRDYSIAQKGAEPCEMQTECLVRAHSAAAVVNVSVRFLQPMAREVCAPPLGEIVPELRVDGRRFQTWHEAVERTVILAPLSVLESSAHSHDFQFPSSRVCEPIRDDRGEEKGVLVRRQDAIAGSVEIVAQPVADDVFKIRVSIRNKTPTSKDLLENQDAILMRTFASTHTVLRVEEGEFISLLDPPPAHAAAAAQCQNVGSWPVLVGDEKIAGCHTMLSSPIILYDYPQIAPESPGDLFDGAEIDEILTLRIMTMTDDEKAEMRDADAHARRILERTESLPADHLLKLHGSMRGTAEDFFNPSAQLHSVTVRGVLLKAGDRVRIRPKKRSDVMDIVLAGKIAIIEAVEHDVEDRVHLALVVEDDPGRELGMTRFPGHRFFYTPEEIEPLEAGE